MICSILSISFVFDRLENIGNHFPFNHEFFIRLARAFPLLRKLRMGNAKSQLSLNLENNQSVEIALYP